MKISHTYICADTLMLILNGPAKIAGLFYLNF